ncbi:type II RES/Xre toxin-antitoxin system antitoxin [Sediminibacterium goheungense]|uniref:Antitoxin Xre-like helix-turn-helix domain-containing protein n=1 Tax=Sediminibacterium goheungense TaxID=1086393 RepID=A0A4R6ISH1_9BACT|nr:antitoxin Xre-like helix-turn-helix domain-containing protein [Sediminibacterium goheungense]TDO25403.1 hypothetical protein BC659_2944 [Sediminibacterium goheungense]
MAKPKKIPATQKPPMVEEAAAAYLPAIADFTYRKFKKIYDQVPFTQAEWAGILHLSERTLQRYAKNNSVFEGIYADRILQLQELIETGLATFTSPDAFYQWLKKDKPVMGHLLNFSSLSTSRGIQETLNQLIRIQQGVYA